MKLNIDPRNIGITPNAMATLDSKSIWASLMHHINCDWGDICPADKKLNNEAIKHRKSRILSSYYDANGNKFWIITEHDLSITTIMLPQDD